MGIFDFTRISTLEQEHDELVAKNDELTAENAKLRAELAEAKRLLRNVMLAEDKDLYSRITDIHEWLTVNDNTTA